MYTDLDKIQLLTSRTLADLQFKVNTLAKLGYAPEGSFNKTSDGRWFFQTMVKTEPIASPAAADAPGSTQVGAKTSRAKSEAKPNRAKKAAKK